MEQIIITNDYGHGGADPGATGNGIVEKSANLITGLSCTKELRRHNIIVKETRDTDKTVSLEERVRIANNNGSKYFISIHHNAGGGDRGEYIHSIYRGNGLALANSIGTEMQNVLGQQKKVYEKMGEGNKDYFYVIRNTNMDAVIVEVCFLDNAEDVKIADTIAEQERNGIVIAHGVLKHLGIPIKPQDNIPTPPPSQPSGEMYRVRKTWADASSQKGAYSILDNAIAECKKHKGYSVFNSKGTIVYSNASVVENIDVIYQVYSNGRWFSNVKNTSDYAGVFGQDVEAMYANLSKGSIEYRVSAVNRDYYSWVKDRQDFAGVLGVSIDRLQMRLVNLPNHKVMYRVKLLKGVWLDWVTDTTDFAGIRGCCIEAVEVKVLPR